MILQLNNLKALQLLEIPQVFTSYLLKPYPLDSKDARKPFQKKFNSWQGVFDHQNQDQTSLLNHHLPTSQICGQKTKSNKYGARKMLNAMFTDISIKRMKSSNILKKIDDLLNIAYQQRQKSGNILTETGRNAIMGRISKREQKRIEKEQYSSVIYLNQKEEEPVVSDKILIENNTSSYSPSLMDKYEQDDRYEWQRKVLHLSSQNTCDTSNEYALQQSANHKILNNQQSSTKRNSSTDFEIESLLKSKRIKSTCDSTFTFSPSNDGSYLSEEEDLFDQKSLKQQYEEYCNLINSKKANANNITKSLQIEGTNESHESNKIRINLQTSHFISYNDEYDASQGFLSDRNDDIRMSNNQYDDIITRQLKEQINLQVKHINLNDLVSECIQKK